MVRPTVALFVLAILGGCQGSDQAQTRAERCATLDMQISATEENGSIPQESKDEMIASYAQEKAELGCAP